MLKFLAASFLLLSAAHAQEIEGLPPGANVQHANMTACDTKEQIRDYLEYGQDAPALVKVNEKYGEEACANGSLVFIEGEKGDSFGAWTFVHVLIVGVMGPDGPEPIQPIAQWTAYKTPEAPSRGA